MLTVDSTCLHKMSQVHSKLPGDDALVIGTENRITWLKIGTERRCPLCKSVQFFKLPLGMTTREHKWLTRCYLLKSIEYLLHFLTCCQVTTCQCYSWIDGRTILCWKLIPRSLRGKLLECFPFFSRNQRFDITGHATTLIYLDISWYVLFPFSSDVHQDAVFRVLPGLVGSLQVWCVEIVQPRQSSSQQSTLWTPRDVARKNLMWKAELMMDDGAEKWWNMKHGKNMDEWWVMPVYNCFVVQTWEAISGGAAAASGPTWQQYSIAAQPRRAIERNGLGTKVGLSMARPTRVCRPS